MVPVGIGPGNFQLPASPSTPIVCIGPGTGIAPFRSLVQHRPSASDLVVFGCRSAAKDFYYRDEWERWERSGGGRLHWCASRDQQDKVYVQDEIVEHGREVWERVHDRGAWVYISGSAIPSSASGCPPVLTLPNLQLGWTDAKKRTQGLEASLHDAWPARRASRGRIRATAGERRQAAGRDLELKAPP